MKMLLSKTSNWPKPILHWIVSSKDFLRRPNIETLCSHFNFILTSHLQTGGLAWLQAVRQARDESRLVVVANSCLLVAANVQMCNHAFLLPTKKPGFSRIDICFNSLAIRMTKLAHFSGIFHPTFSPYSFLGYTSESSCLSS